MKHKKMKEENKDKDVNPFSNLLIAKKILIKFDEENN
jgi:hypothetical protein